MAGIRRFRPPGTKGGILIGHGASGPCSAPGISYRHRAGAAPGDRRRNQRNFSRTCESVKVKHPAWQILWNAVPRSPDDLGQRAKIGSNLVWVGKRRCWSSWKLPYYMYRQCR